MMGIFQESVCLMTMETGVGLPTTRFQGVDSQSGRALETFSVKVVVWGFRPVDHFCVMERVKVRSESVREVMVRAFCSDFVVKDAAAAVSSRNAKVKVAAP